ncbi:MAG: spondin domain-containing protein [Gammaproteobacteria bacterium]|nr:spondin domain-containing protein [Gammaproteobacteria bacterium]
MKFQRFTAAAVGALALCGSATAAADTFDVTVTNVSQNQLFTPILVVTHRPSVRLFSLGEPASQGIAEVAESGDPTELEAALRATGRVKDAQNLGVFLAPGESATVSVKADWQHRRISLVGMLLPTNDGMIAVNSVRIPHYGTKTVTAIGYDAGTEINDQLCDNIPGGGGCSGEGFNAEDGEGFVHVHPGIHDTGDLTGAAYDWNNPMAVVKIRRSTY